MRNIEKIKSLTQNAIDVLMKSGKFNDYHMQVAQSLSLQGEKRRLRYYSAKTHQLVSFLITTAYDCYLICLNKTYSNKEYSEITTFNEFFQTCIGKMEEEHDAISEIANQLILIHAKGISEQLNDYCKCLESCIIEYRRIIAQGIKTNWSPDFLLYYEVSNHNIHDSIEEEEKKIGYKF